ncbi:hypothetical protein MNB_ARC-1_756 [hydrothermal vent metagenome]|uniref:Uncharacterized protein n=1 Tax=hydrothermal vent metagenome TaxID=652676 RepID=A0A3B1DTZ8_9ZZZZ
MKKSFALFITIILVTLFATLSISIVETKTISTNIDTLKYLYLQSNMHLHYIKKYIQTHTKQEIKDFKLNDQRFTTNIILEDENNKTIYYIYIKTKDDTAVSLYDTVIK